MFQEVSTCFNHPWFQHDPLFAQPPKDCKRHLGTEEFGNDQHPKDLLQNGVLQVAPAAPGAAACGAFRNLLPLSRLTTVYWEVPDKAGGFGFLKCG